MKDKLLSNLKLVIINSIVFVFLIIMLELISSLRDKTLLVDNKKQNEKINKYYDKLNSNRSVYGDSLLPPIVPNLFLYDTLIPLGSVSNYYTQFQTKMEIIQFIKTTGLGSTTTTTIIIERLMLFCWVTHLFMAVALIKMRVYHLI